MNYSNNDFYLNDQQSKEQIFQFDDNLKLKDKIVESLLSICIPKNWTLEMNKFNLIVRVLTFYLNSTIDHDLEDKSKMINSKACELINQLISFFINDMQRFKCIIKDNIPIYYCSFFSI